MTNLSSQPQPRRKFFKRQGIYFRESQSLGPIDGGFCLCAEFYFLSHFLRNCFIFKKIRLSFYGKKSR